MKWMLIIKTNPIYLKSVQSQASSWSLGVSLSATNVCICFDYVQLAMYQINYTVSNISFSTGQIFGYWPDWEMDTKKPDTDETEIYNGYSKAELYIKTPFYASINEYNTLSRNIRYSKR